MPSTRWAAFPPTPAKRSGTEKYLVLCRYSVLAFTRPLTHLCRILSLDLGFRSLTSVFTVVRHPSEAIAHLPSVSLFRALTSDLWHLVLRPLASDL